MLLASSRSAGPATSQEEVAVRASTRTSFMPLQGCGSCLPLMALTMGYTVVVKTLKKRKEKKDKGSIAETETEDEGFLEAVLVVHHILLPAFRNLWISIFRFFDSYHYVSFAVRCVKYKKKK